MDEIVKALFGAPLATVFVIAGLIFLLVAVVGNISGKIEPGPKGRLFSGILGLAFVIVGLAMHFAQNFVQPSTTPNSPPALTKPAEQIAVVPQAANNSLVNTPANQAPATLNLPANAEIIEAGCSFSGMQIEGEPGSTHLVACPADCDAAYQILNGTDTYTNNSYICLAAIHAGLIGPQGGTVQVIIEKGRPAYRGSIRHKIQSSDYGKYDGSFRLASPTQ
ncbi:LCCL domain-containing protein [Methylomonas rosea]|uniref:LCCL domain-containing protein n=1 Tax=Methylomonas rosea TaxID=2952227 RepID=A0ABT1TXN3_9GAMM|nr:LCCL domain-containing protein [Methylomonas sp. WSC-7]MCQ8119527.1 LCCL domain-containing protein [Methylomonas sp. WSC-7]